MLVVAAAAMIAQAGIAADAPREPTDVHIRRLAGLPADSARGQVEILDVGHDPMSTMLSIVGRRTADGWRVSYACAGSLACRPGSDHAAVDYALPVAAATELDGLLDRLRKDGEPDGTPPRAGVIGGWLHVAIDDRGFRHDYARVGSWGRTLGRIETLLAAPGQAATTAPAQ
ncbi:hypothetical protein DM480_03790 [Sphingomonas sp. FARSPH]|nr:hypothetical protein DM480_03790 [Sphingomonas sp. FARSPH]